MLKFQIEHDLMIDIERHFLQRRAAGVSTADFERFVLKKWQQEPKSDWSRHRHGTYVIE